MRVIQVVSAFIFSPDQTQLLLVNNVGGRWSLPGGGVEAGETLEQAVVREVAEETGLTVVPDRLAEIAEGFNPHENLKIIFFGFLVTRSDLSETPRIVLPDEISDVKWVPVGDVVRYLPYLTAHPHDYMNRAGIPIRQTKII